MKSNFIKAAGAAVLAATLAGCNATQGGFIRPQSNQPDAAPTQGAAQVSQIAPMARPAQSGLYPDKYCEATLQERSDAGRLWANATATATNLDDTCVGIRVGHKNKATGKIDESKPVREAYLHMFLNACQGRNVAASTVGKIIGFVDRKAQIEEQRAAAACKTELTQAQNYAAGVIKYMEQTLPGKTKGTQTAVEIDGSRDLTDFKIPSAVRGRVPNLESVIPSIPAPSFPTRGR
ncbi:MAG: hypothetical protein RBR86_06575 [Pseudobdellovibrionaceae bacterium]|jgi:hypothetical protein|nr:hypothetical protein [Pseudobdellovibrionaceae bacterium]